MEVFLIIKLFPWRWRLHITMGAIRATLGEGGCLTRVSERILYADVACDRGFSSAFRQVGRLHITWDAVRATSGRGLLKTTTSTFETRL